MSSKGKKPLHRKKGDWIAVAKGRSNKDRFPRQTAMCPWHCGVQITVGGGPLMGHLTRCKSRGGKG